MANNELIYSVKFQYDTENIKNIVDDVQKKLQNITVTIKGGKIDLGEVTTQINDVKRDIESLGKLDLSGLKQSFDGLTTQLKEFSLEIKSLNTNFGANLGNSIVDALSKADAQIKTTIENLNKLAQAEQNASGGSSGGGGKALDKAENSVLAKNAAQASKEYESLKAKVTEINRELEASQKIGFSTDRLNSYRNQLESVMGILDKIKADPSSKLTTEVIDEQKVRSAVVALNAELNATKEVTEAYQKLQEKYQQLQGYVKTDPAAAKSAKEIAGLMKSITDLPKGGSRVELSENINRSLKQTLDTAAQVVKVNEQRMATEVKSQQEQAQIQRESGREMTRQSIETQKAQEKVQAEIDATSRKINELYDNILKLRGLSAQFPRLGLSQPISDAAAKMRELQSVRAEMGRRLVAGDRDPNNLVTFARSQQLTSWRNGLTQVFNDIASGMKKAEQSMDVTPLLEKVRAKLVELDHAGQQAGNMHLNGLERQALDAYYELDKLRVALMEIKHLGQTSGGLDLKGFIKTGQFSNGISQAASQLKAIENGISRAESTILQKRRERNDKEISRLKETLRELQQMRNVNPQVKVAGVENAIREVQMLIEQLEKAKAAGLSRKTVDLGRWGVGETAGTMAHIHSEHSSALRVASVAADQNTAAQRRMEQAIASATGKAQQQSQVLSDLRSMAAQYLGVWGAWNFAKEVANITGELELQQKSLEVILGSAGKAQELFNDIKGLSQMSPYTFQDMLKSTRQLAAFGVETKDLYDTMKSLSDLGAGLNVDVQRLILAYGHVKSAGVLSGIQRRQFETAGINITGEIAKLYNERYKAAGSDERVSTGDIFKRITKREIGFNDVEQVIKRLTGPGGKFADMQLKQYETLGGKLRNLQNNYNIMLDEIGKSYMDFLTMGVDGMNDMMEHWRTWKNLIVDVVAALAAAKAASLAFGKTWAANMAATAAFRRERYEGAQIANIRPDAGKVGVASSMRSVGYADTILATEGLNKFQKMQMALHKTVSSFDRQYTAMMLGFSKNYQQHVAGLTRWGLAWERMKLSAQSFFASFKAGIRSIAFNPMTTIMLATSAITAFIQRRNELNEMRDRFVESGTETAKKEIEEIKGILEETKSVTRLADDPVTGGKKIEIDENNLELRGAMSTITELEEAMQKHDPLYKGHLVDIKQMSDEKDKVLGMIGDLNDAKAANEEYENITPAIGTAIKNSGGAGRDTLTEEMKEYEEEWNNLHGQIMVSRDAIDGFLTSQQALSSTIPWVKSLAEYYQQMKQANPSMATEQILEQAYKTGHRFNFGERYGNEKINPLEEWRNSTLSMQDPRWRQVQLGKQIDTSELDSKKKAISEKMKGIVDVYRMGLDNMARAGKGTKAKALFIKKALDDIIKTAENEISNSDVGEQLQNLILKGMVPDKDSGEKMTEDMKSVFVEMEDQLANAQISDMLSRAMSKGIIGSESSPEQIRNAIQSEWNMLKDAMIAQADNPELKDIIQNSFNKIFEGVMINPKPLLEGLSDTWKDVYRNVEEATSSDWWSTFQIQLNAAIDDKELWNNINAKIEEDIARIQQLGTQIDVFHTINFDFLATADASAIDAAISKVSGVSVMDVNQPAKEELLRLLKEVKNLAGATRTFGRRYTPKSGGGGGHKGGSGHKSGGGGGHSSAKNDAERKAEEAARKEREFFEQRLDWIKQLREEYKKWKESFSPEEAWKKAVEYYTRQYPNADEGPLKGISLDKRSFVEAYADLLARVSEEIKKNPKLNNKLVKDWEEMVNELIRKLEKSEADTDRTVFEENMESATGEFNTMMESVVDGFERARKVYEATRDIGLTGEIAPMIGENMAAANLDDVLREALESSIMSSMPNLGEDVISQLESGLNKVKTLSDEDIESYARELVGKEGTAEYSAVLADWLKRYKQEYKNLQDRAVEAYADALGQRKDYTSLLTKIDGDLAVQTDLIRETNAGEDIQERLEKILQANAQLEMIKLDPLYARFMNSDVTMSSSDMSDMMGQLFGTYLAQFTAGGKTAEEMGSQSQELLEKMKSWSDAQIETTLDISRMGKLTREYNEALSDYLEAVRTSYMTQKNLAKAEKELAKAQEKEKEEMENYGEGETAEKLRSYFGTKNELVKLGTALREEEDKPRNEWDADHISELKEEIKNLRDTLSSLENDKEVRTALDEYNARVYNAQQNTAAASSRVDEIEEQVDSDTAGVNDAWKILKNILLKLIKQKELETTFDKVIEHLNTFQSALGLVTETLDTLGIDAGALHGVSDALGSGLSGASALSALGEWGMGVGGAIGLIGGIVMARDNAIQRKIDDIRHDTEKMSNTLESIRSLRERSLGYDTGAMRRMMQSLYGAGATFGVGTTQNGKQGGVVQGAVGAMMEYYGRYSGGSGYEQELKLLEEQRKKLMEMYNLEDSKKKKSKEELEDYKNQIADLDQQIMFFTEDLANQLWEIDLKGWADQLGDALMTAFENGTSAASAFKDAVQDIMRGVVKNMLTVGIIEPALENLRVKLFGTNGEGGLFNSKDPKGSMGAVLEGLGEWFSTEGPALMDAANEFYNGADDMMRQILGYGMRENERSTATTNSITSTASEETMGVVAGYLSRLSQDVSVQRIMQEMFVNGSWPDYVEQVTTANDSLASIDRSTMAVMEMMRDGNGALYDRVESMSRRLDNFANGIDTITVH